MPPDPPLTLEPARVRRSTVPGKDGRSAMVGAAEALTDTGRYLHWGWFSISLTNLLIIAAMLVVFVLALLLPFPGGHETEPAVAPTSAPPDQDGSQP